MKQYVLTSPNLIGKITLEYDVHGGLVKFNNEAEFSAAKHSWFGKNFPYHVSGLDLLKVEMKQLTITVIKRKIIWEEFWVKYGNTNGSKKKGEAIWDKMNQEAQVMAFDYIDRYNAHLKQTGLAKAYTTTYLHGEYWLK